MSTRLPSIIGRSDELVLSCLIICYDIQVGTGWNKLEQVGTVWKSTHTIEELLEMFGQDIIMSVERYDAMHIPAVGLVSFAFLYLFWFTFLHSFLGSFDGTYVVRLRGYPEEFATAKTENELDTYGFLVESYKPKVVLTNDSWRLHEEIQRLQRLLTARDKQIVLIQETICRA